MKQLKRTGACRLCGSCCTFFSLVLKHKPEGDMLHYYELHGIKFEHDPRTDATIWIMPVRCTMLTEDNKCKLHGTQEKPLICQNAPTLKEKRNHERVGCSFKWELV